jgi:pyruvate/2-oxoglutarate dehydrogenase complex dihydrolipoamide acyltransferase (E2) component
MVKKARNGKLTVDDFAGTTISLTNPGTIGTVHSVPRLMQGQGAIIGVGRDGIPGRVAGRIQRHPQPQRRQQDPHAHLDLRPPDHPGRPER